MDTNYPETTLSIIDGANILESSDMKILEDLRGELQETFATAQVFRTRTEMEASVLNDHKYPTPDAKYWQAIREQDVMLTELVILSYEYRKTEVEIKKLVRNLHDEVDDLEKELMCVELDRLRFVRLQQERVAKDRIREIREWHEIKQSLLPHLQYSLTDVNEHQLLSYTERWINQLMCSGNASAPELNNIVGQLDKGLKMCAQKGLTPKLVEKFGTTLLEDFNKHGIGGNDTWKHSLPQPTPA